jgi:hypothetical protein
MRLVFVEGSVFEGEDKDFSGINSIADFFKQANGAG